MKAFVLSDVERLSLNICYCLFKGDSSTSSGRVTLHKFPLHDENLTKHWLKAMHREDFKPTEFSRLCSLHFHPIDFVTDSKDSNNRRKRKRGEVVLAKRRLSDTAVPSVFPHAPSYLSSEAPVVRGTRATAEGRRELEESYLADLMSSFEQEDDITNLTLQQLMDKLLADDNIPSEFECCLRENTLIIYHLTLTDHVPKIRSSIALDSERNAVVSVDGIVLPASQLNDLLIHTVRLYSQLTNLMARVKALSTDSNREPVFLFTTALHCLGEYVKTLEESTDECRKLNFLLEQLQLITVNKHGRHYTPQLVLLAYKTVN